MIVRSPADTVAARSARREARRSFTLVEMVVTIGIIVVLAALTVSATVALVNKSEVRQTENVLRLLDTAIQEWEAEADRKLTWGVEVPPPGPTYDMYDEVPHVYTISEVVYRIEKSEVVTSILARIGPEFVYEYKNQSETDPPPWITRLDPQDPDPRMASGKAGTIYGADPAMLNNRPIKGMRAILDAWGTPIRVVHSGRAWSAVDDRLMVRDDDGTIRVEIDRGSGETSYGAEEFYGLVRSRRILFVSAGPDGKFGNLDKLADPDRHDQAHDNVYSYVVPDEAHE